MDAAQGRYKVVLDIPGAFLHAKLAETVHMKIKGELARLLVQIAPEIYGKSVVYENGKMVLYVLLKKQFTDVSNQLLHFGNTLLETCWSEVTS